MTRVCHISTVHVPNDVRVFNRECCSLVKAGYEVHLVISNDKSCIKDGVQIHALPKAKNRLIRMFVLPWIAMSKALKTRSEIYHYHDPELMFVGFILRWVFRKKAVYDIHESVHKHILGKTWLPKWSRKPVAKAYRILEKVLTKGQSLMLANEFSLPDYDDSVYLVRNYPLLNESLIEESMQFKREYENPLFVYVGGVAESRGAITYVELTAELIKRGHNIRMAIIGPYTEQLGKKINEKAKELNIADRITLTGRIDNAEAMSYISRATLGLCLLKPVPNYTTCLATKIIEYMMLGVPTLASDFDCWRQYVETEKTGKMADPENLNQIVDTCEAMLNDREELIAMGKRGMEVVRSKYNWDSEFNVLLKCYRDLLGPKYH